MPTIFSHVAVPVCLALALGSRRVPPPMLLAGMLAAVVPDFDGVAFKLGLAYGGIWGHRGFTHTLGFALFTACLGWALAPRWKVPRWAGFAWVGLCAWSHPLLDMLTNGGVAIPLFWPFSGERFFSPWRPIEVSPVALSRFLTQRGADVLLNELRTVWWPLLTLGLAGFALRHCLPPRRAPLSGPHVPAGHGRRDVQ